LALLESKPIRTVLRWQLYATIAAALIAGLWQGLPGAISAALGGTINLTAGAVFGCFASRAGKRSVGVTLVALFRAEASKVALIVILLWLVLSVYKQVALAAFFGTFFVTALLFSAAMFVRDR
jgi:ATP synthase protein I